MHRITYVEDYTLQPIASRQATRDHNYELKTLTCSNVVHGIEYYMCPTDRSVCLAVDARRCTIAHIACDVRGNSCASSRRLARSRDLLSHMEASVCVWVWCVHTRTRASAKGVNRLRILIVNAS